MKYEKSMFARTSPEDLRRYLEFKRRGSRVEAKKGKGSYRRSMKNVHRGDDWA